MKQKTVFRFFLMMGLAFWALGGVSSADDTQELGTYYPSQKGKMKSIGVKESMIFAPQAAAPTTLATDSPPGTLYYDADKNGLYFSDGVNRDWRSVASNSSKNPLKVKMVKAGAQEMSDAAFNATIRKSSGTNRTLAVPGWNLVPAPSGTPPPYRLFTSRPNYKVADSLEINLDKLGGQSFFSILWGGKIGVDAATGKGIRVELQYTKADGTWYRGSKALDSVTFYDDDGLRNGTFDYKEIEVDAICGGPLPPPSSGACASPPPGVCAASHTDDVIVPRYTLMVTDDNARKFVRFRIVVYRDGGDSKVIANIAGGDAEHSGLSFDVQQET